MLGGGAVVRFVNNDIKGDFNMSNNYQSWRFINPNKNLNSILIKQIGINHHEKQDTST